MDKNKSNQDLASYSTCRTEDLRIVEWFEKLRSFLPELPFKQTERNDKLRPGIIKQSISQFLTDDERARMMGLPVGCRIREGAKIISPENLEMGDFCWIGEHAVLDASGGLTIGDHTSIGLSVFVWSHSSHLTNLNFDNQINSDLIQRKPTMIGSGCFIAGPSVILPGVSIGNQVLIRPFTTVDKDIPDRSLVAPSGVKEGFFTDAIIAKMTHKVRSPAATEKE